MKDGTIRLVPVAWSKRERLYLASDVERVLAPRSDR
jgi:hypothetical protein